MGISGGKFGVYPNSMGNTDWFLAPWDKHWETRLAERKEKERKYEAELGEAKREQKKMELEAKLAQIRQLKEQLKEQPTVPSKVQPKKKKKNKVQKHRTVFSKRGKKKAKAQVAADSAGGEKSTSPASDITMSQEVDRAGEGGNSRESSDATMVDDLPHGIIAGLSEVERGH